MMKISIIVAMSENRTIGLDNGLPWHLPADLKRFRRLTMGHHLILGRKTYESLPGPLPGRNIIVLTRNRQYRPTGCQVAHSLQDALHIGTTPGAQEIFIGGGASVYADALAGADRMYLTLVHAIIRGDTFFPQYAETEWETVHSEFVPLDDKNAYSSTYKILERKTPTITKQ